MNRVESHTFAAEPVFESWLKDLSDALAHGDADQAAKLFASDGHWKDLLAFTWQHRTFSGPDQIKAAFAATIAAVAPTNLRQAQGRTPPRLLRRSGKNVLEGYFDFDTKAGRGAAFVRLAIDGDARPRILLLLTTLQELRGHEEKLGKRRPTGDEYASNVYGRSWRQDRDRRLAYADRDPQVVVVGAGQAGLTIAARLQMLGVDTLVVEKTERVGNVWRDRYESLTLHNETMANHLPYLPFPDSWPLWLAKDQLATWLEGYAQLMDLNVWTATALSTASYDEASRSWSITLKRADGSERKMTCRHLVMATGASGGLPNMPHLQGIETYQGQVLHSRDFKNGADFKGKEVIVVGTGNSGHDIAQDLVVKGAKKVWMYQRGPTCVVSLQPTAAMVYKVYSEGAPTDDVDMVSAAVPYPVLEDTYRFITKKGAELDKDLLAGLKKAGFQTYFGRDGTGFQMMFLRGEGGYYIDVGCSKLIIDGTIGVIQHSDAAGFSKTGLTMKDGTVITCDAVILATGFKNMQETIRMMLGDTVADRVGRVWGFDEHYQMRNMWRRTAQPGLWMTGGSLLDSRVYSRFLALEIKAELEGILPKKSALPLAS